MALSHQSLALPRRQAGFFALRGSIKLRFLYGIAQQSHSHES